MLLHRCLSFLGLAPQRENEYDSGRPGVPRPMTGLYVQLTEEQKKLAASYEEPHDEPKEREHA
jgi:hypothetical protein